MASDSKVRLDQAPGVDHCGQVIFDVPAADNLPDDHRLFVNQALPRARRYSGASIEELYISYELTGSGQGKY
jgi:hypothetical protein